MAGTSYKGAEIEDVDHFLKGGGVDSEREKTIGQHIGYRYDVNLVPDYDHISEFLKGYIEYMGWEDLNWLEDVHMGYDDGKAAVFDRNINGWVAIPEDMDLPDNQQDRDMVAREMLIKFQMSPDHPMVTLNKAYRKFGPGSSLGSFVDAVVLIDGIGDKTAEALKAEGVTTLTQISNMSDISLAALSEKVGAGNQWVSRKWRAQANEMIRGLPPRAKVDQELAKKMAGK